MTTNNSIFQEPHEKGSEEIFYEKGVKEMGFGMAVVVIFIICAVVGGLFFMKHASGGSEEYGGGVYEAEGTLYYPDGIPVRNYEQLDRYLNETN